MDIQRREGRETISEHEGTVRSLFFYRMEELRDEVNGYLEFVNEFSIAEGVSIEPHSHDTDEFYYVLEGRGTMIVDGERAPFGVGELVRIRPNLVHSLAADQGEAMRCFCFAISYMPRDRVGFTAYPVDGGEPHFVSTRYWD